MASVDKLELSGIRSFNPDPSRREVIRFRKPLTVILGKNGAGKTTIIEALLNATTGKFPPGCGTEKASFIYDPKVAGEHSVKAQIRLEFTGRDGNPGRVIRSYQVDSAASRKTEKAKFGNLECVISTLDSRVGSFVNASYNAGEADARLRDLLGVSTAVLEHVIFCHQEECNWPLGSAAEVKSNFDAIFAATRYVAALENLKENQRKYSRELKEYERSLIELRERRAQAVDLRESVARKTEEVRLFELRNRGIEPQLAQLRECYRAVESVRHSTEELVRESNVTEGRIHEKVHQLERMKLPPAKQTLEELQEMARNFSAHMAKLEEDVSTKQSSLEAMELAKRQRDADVIRCQAQARDCARAMQEHKQRCAALQQLVGASTSEFVVSETEIDDAALQRLRERLASSARDAAAALGEAQQAHERSVAAARSKVEEAHRALDADAKERELKEACVAQTSARCVEVKRELDSLNEASLERHIQTEESAITALDKRIEAAQQARQSGDAHALEVSLTTRLSDCHARLSDIRTAMLQKQRAGARELQIPFLRERVSERRAWMQEKIRDVIVPQLREAGRTSTAVDAPLHTLTSLVEQLLEQKRDASRAGEREQLQQEREVASLRHLLEERRQEVARLEIDRKRHATAYAASIGAEIPLEQFPSRLQQLEALQLKQCRHLSSIESMAKCYEGFVEAAKTEGVCVVCKRSLDANALSDFVHLNEDRQKTTPQQVDGAKRELHKTTDLLKRLKAAEHQVSEIRRLDDAIVAAKTQIQVLDADVASKAAFLSDTVNKRRIIEDQLRHANNLRDALQMVHGAASEVDRLEREVATLTAEVERDAAAAAPSSSSTVSKLASLEELEAAFREASDEEERLSMQLCEVRARQAGQPNEEVALRQEQVALRESLSAHKAKWGRAKDLKTLLHSLEAERDGHVERLKVLSQRRQEQQLALDASRSALEALEPEWRARSAALRATQSAADAALERLDAASTPVVQFVRIKGVAQAQAAAHALQAAEAAQAQLERESAALKDAIAQIRTVVGDQHRRFAELTRHMDALELQKKLEDERHRLSVLQQQLHDAKMSRIGGVEALLGPGAAQESLPRVEELLQQKISALERARAQQEGNVEAMQRELVDLERRLNSEAFHNVDDRYSSVFIKLQTMELAVSDIDKYYKALDKAVQSYHQDKIQQVNAIIAELWRAIYRGSDIDTIELKSEVDGSATAAGTSRRNYNYRVVMRRGTHEIDMRAKCSAGQKVLASVVIRVALSEAFSCDCGVLALDEPTTNLDEDNARSLAEALRDLIETRKSSRTFQLIVITHDEHFVRALGSQSVNKFYFVHKDREGAFSRIEERTFDQLFS